MPEDTGHGKLADLPVHHYVRIRLCPTFTTLARPEPSKYVRKGK